MPFDLKSWVVENKYLVVLFTLSTSFFILLHYFHFSWDFVAYVLNAKHWVGVSNYYELLRPPLMPLILLLLSPFGWLASEYMYIILISGLFAYSIVKLANSVKINNRDLFYFLSLSPYVLFQGLVNGTELLSLALFQLFLVYIFERKDFAGLYLGLACLTRYNFLIFLPLVVFTRDIKSIVKNIVYFALPFIPWFAYNYTSTGNIFTALADSYALNVILRSYAIQPIDYVNFLNIIAYLLPFFSLGIIYTIYRWKKFGGSLWNFLKVEEVNIIMLTVLLLSVYQYILIPIKNERFLSNHPFNI